MPTYLRPGVYVEELSAPASEGIVGSARSPDLRVRSRWTAERGTTAFLGWRRAGPSAAPVMVRSFQEYERLFGVDRDQPWLASAVHGFFANGGSSCYVCWTGPDHHSTEDRVSSEDFVGSYEPPSGLQALHPLPVSTVVLPDLTGLHARGLLDLDALRAVQAAAIAHCEMVGSRMALLDPPNGFNAREVLDWRYGLDSEFAVLYWPGIRTTESGGGSGVLAPGTGHVAGVLSRLDQRFGPHWSPLYQTIAGAEDLAADHMKLEQDMLNPAGINVLGRSADGLIRVLGARTLSTNPLWRWLPNRRLMNFVLRNLTSGTEWAMAARADDAQVWAQLAHDVDGLLRLLWHGGALGGEHPGAGFTVACDARTNADQMAEQPGVIRLDATLVLREAGRVAIRVKWMCG